MGNPFDKIKAENAQLRTNNGNSGGTSLNIERFTKSYASIHDEYREVSANVRSVSANVKAEMEAETKRIEDEQNKRLKKAALFSLVGTVATQLPQIVTGITSLLSTTKSIKAGDTSASAQSTLQQAEQKLQQAKQQSTSYGQQITEATTQKPQYEQTVKDQEAERIKQQGLYDQYKQQEDTLQASLDNETDSAIVSAKSELADAEKMKTTKTVRDPQTGKTKQVEDASLKEQKEQKIAAARKKIEDRKTALKAEIAEAKKNKETAQRANAAAIEARDNAQLKVDELRDKINELTPKKNKLDNEIQQLEAEIRRIKGDTTTQTQTGQKPNGSEPATR